MANKIIKYQPQNALVKKADNYLAHLNALMPKKYAPDLPDLIPYRKGDLWGFCDRDKKIVIECKYDCIEIFKGDKALVRQNEKWGVINKRGFNIISCIYEQCSGPIDGLYKVALGGWGFINEMGNQIIECEYRYDEIYNFKDGMVKIKLNDKYGFINKNGTTVVIPKYDYVRDFKDGLSAVGIDGKWGVIDKFGFEIIPLQFDSMDSFSEGLALVSLNKRRFFININGIETFSLNYDYADAFSEGLATVWTNYKFGYINKIGVEIISLKYHHATSFCEGLALVKNADGLCGFINKEGIEITQFKYLNPVDEFYESRKFVFNAGLIWVESIEGYGLVNTKGIEVFSCTFDWVGYLNEEYSPIVKNGKFGYINKRGIEIIICKYEAPDNLYNINRFEYGLAEICIGNTISNFFFIDKLGNEYWENEFDI